MNNRINKLHERALRFVYNDYISSYDALLKKDGSVCIHCKNIRSVALEMYKIKNNLAPEMIQNLVQKSSCASRKNFLQPKKNTVKFGDNSFSTFGPIVWDDMLPAELKTNLTLREFKKALKTWIPSNCSCKLCKLYVNGVGYIYVSTF